MILGNEFGLGSSAIAGKPGLIPGGLTLHLTDTAILQLPINCVVAGQQPIGKRLIGLDGALNPSLRGIFRE